MADDYSAIATPVADDYSAIATPVDSMKLVAAGDKNFKVPDSMRVKGLAIKESDFAKASPFERLKMIVSNPWQKYKISVDQGFKGPEIPRIESDGNAAEQAAAGVANTATGAASGLISPGAAIAAINPMTLAYSAPRFIAGGLEALSNIGTDKTTQQNVESGLGGALQLVGGKMALTHGVRAGAAAPARIAAEIAEPVAKPKSPSLIPQIEDASSAKNPGAANVAANELAMKAPEPAQPAQPTPPPVDTTPQPKATTPELVAGMNGKQFMDHFSQDGVSMTDEAVKVGESATTEEGIANLKKLQKEAEAQYEAAKARKDIDEASGLAYKPQFFREAHEVATKTGGWADDVLKPTDNAPKTLLEGENFDKEWKDQGGQGGSENQVIFKDGKVYKRNYNQKLGVAVPNYGSLEAYNDHIALHNDIFPSAKITFEGLSDTSDGPAPVTSQPEIKGVPASPKEIRAYMQERDFKPAGEGKFINEDTGIQVEDLRGKNVLKDADGNLHVIDPVIKRVGAVDPYAEIAEPVPSASAPAKEASPLPDFVLPKELAGAKPRYSYGAKQFQLKFASDLDRSLYILAQKKLSARDGDYLKAVTDFMGVSEEEARAAGLEIRDLIKQQAKTAKHGDTLTVPDSRLTQQENAVPIQSPESVPVPAQAEVSKAVGEEVRRGDEPSFARPEAQAQITQSPEELQSKVAPPEAKVLATDADVAKIAADHGGGEPPKLPPSTTSGAGGESSPVYKQGLTKYGLGLGKAAEFAKVAVGTIEGNIRAASPKVFGVLRNYENSKAALSLKFEDATLPASRLARRILTEEGNNQLGNLLMSGKIAEAKKLVADNTRYGQEMGVAIDSVRQALDYAHKIESEARGPENVNYIKDYFPRQLINYNEFRKALGKEEQAAADAAIRRAQAASEEKLTPEEVSTVINNFISQSRAGAGKPGFLKPRTIKTIDSNLAQFYEPWDVALENYLRRVTNDVTNRAYFGKFTPGEGAIFNPDNGHFGKVIGEEIAAGRLTGKAQNIVIDNLQDRFSMETQRSGIMSDIGRKIRFAQTAAYLGQLSTAVAQYGDVFQQLLHYGPIDTIKGNFNRKVSLRDFGLHEGNVETAQFSRQKGLVDKAGDLVVKFGVGLSDQFNKGGTANAILHHFADVVKKPESAEFDSLRRKYEQRFPEQWPQILKEISSKEFAEGKIKNLPEAQFFLYSEMADVYPVNPSGMAQGYNAAHPLAKPFWGLKSYMIKQLDIMRDRGYEKLKDPSTRGEGLAYLAAYGAIVAAGQNFAVSWLRDKLANRQTDTAEYFIGGMLQPFGLSRYTISQMRKGEYGKAIAEQLLPALTLAKEATNDVGLARDLLEGRRDKRTGERTVKGLGDLAVQSESVKHFPIVGSIFYNRYGKGAANEKKIQDQKAKGRAQPNTFDTISDIIVPKETSKKN